MPRYPFAFHQADALTYLAEHGREYDAIHASPPCQAYTTMNRFGKGSGREHPALSGATRYRLRVVGKPWIIENVVGAPLIRPVRLCGSSFGLGVRRHRLFESSIPLVGSSCQHRDSPRPIAVYGDHPQGALDRSYRINRATSLSAGQQAMGIDWMEWGELTQAIPPAYTRFVGEQLHAWLTEHSADEGAA